MGKEGDLPKRIAAAAVRSTDAALEETGAILRTEIARNAGAATEQAFDAAEDAAASVGAAIEQAINEAINPSDEEDG